MSDTQKAYQQAATRLAELEREQATLDARIREFSLAGQHRAVADAATRKLILPHVIEQARRDLAPLALAVAEEEHAAAEALMPPLAAAVEAAQEAVRQAQADLDAAVSAAQAQHATVQELWLRRRDAWRRVQAYEQSAAAD